jgi:serine/threonine protein kinase
VSTDAFPSELLPEYDPVASLDAQRDICDVWHVVHRTTRRHACLKVDRRPAPEDEPKYGAHREAEILRRLQGCPCVPRVYASGTVADRGYLEVELTEGESVEQMTKDDDQACRIGARVARALALVHQAGVVWRNLKPKGIWNPLGELRFLEFGVAAALDESERLAAGASIAGTPGYMAPEQIEGRAAAAAMDRYALGVLLFQMLTGRLPFERTTGAGIDELFARVLRDNPPDLRALRPDLAPALSQPVMDLLARRPEDRPGLDQVAHTLDLLPERTGRKTTLTVTVPEPAAPGQKASRDLPLSQREPAPATDPLPPGQPPPAAADESPGLLNLHLVQSVAEIQTNAVFPEPPPDDPGVKEARDAAARPQPAAEDSPDQSKLGSVSIWRQAPPQPGAVPPRPGSEEASALLASGAGPGAADAGPAPVHKSIRRDSRLGPYQILDIIGEGTFGTVYLAQDTQSMLGTRVALKIPKSQSLTPKELDLYRHEAKLWKALSEDRHPNVLELYNLNRFDGVIAFVMEYVDGSDLREFVRRRWEQSAFPLSEALRILRSIAEALRAIHAKRVYHGDLKPANVLVRREDGAVKVTDFSISRSVTASGRVPAKLVGGTPAYMAPEVWEAKPSLQSDIFALGVMFYQLVTGQLPFTASDASELQGVICEGRLTRLPSESRPDLPFALERIILRCLEVNVEDRYPSVGELIEDLQAADTTQDLVTRLAECIMTHSAPEDLDFLVKRDLPGRGYPGDDPRTLVIEYCLDEDPLRILLSCFSKAGLSRLAERLGASVPEDQAEQEHYAQAILQRLGLAGGSLPRGIHDSVVFVANLRHRLEQSRDAADMAGFVGPAAREYEKVLRDLLRFYGQFLYGRFHERTLVRLARKRLAEHKRDLSRATLGELIGVLEGFNEHLAGDSAEAQHFRKVFGRPYAVSPDHLARSHVTSVRNRFMHWNETLARASLGKVRDVARELLDEVAEFLAMIERDGVYPRIVAVESFVTDRFGRKYVYCRNDQGQVEKVFTNVAVDPSRHYFFYPTTNPMRIYPILVPV